jgi:RNA polymerase sigma factor (sigma-70 family)
VKPLMVAAPREATDNQLVVAAQQGSDTAFEALFRRYRARITAYVRGIVSDQGRAEDIVQEVFMSALRGLRSTDREVTFKPWVYEIAKNACIDHIRRARRASEVSIDSDDFSPVDEGRLSASVTTTDAAYAAREDLDALTMAFNDLPMAQREILVSRELEGLSYDKISSRTGLSRSAVESMLFRARRTLKDGYDDIATGERCQRMQTVMSHLVDGQIGVRQERRLLGHLRDCAACRREAVALGLDDLLFAAPARTRSALSRIAALLPLPAFLRRRFTDGAGLLGSGSAPAAEQGASLAAKAAVVLAAAAIAGGGADAAQKVGVVGQGGGSQPGKAVDRQPSGLGKPSLGSPRGGERGRDSGAPPGGGKSPGSGGTAGKSPGGGSSAGGSGGGADGGKASGPLGGVANEVTGTVDNTVKGVGGTATGTGGSIDKTVDRVTGTTNGVVGGSGGEAVSGLGQAATGALGTVTDTVGGATSTLPKAGQTTPALPKLTP